MGGLARGPARLATGTLFVGKSGSGKSVLIKKMLADVLALGEPLAALDLADELHDFLASRAPPGTQVRVVGGYHEGDAKIDLGPLLRSETDRRRFALKVFPDVKNDPQPFFNLSARELFFQAVCVLAFFGPGKAELADVLRLVFNRRLLSALGKLVPGVGDPFADLGDKDTAKDVYATALARLRPLSVIAALWLRCRSSVDVLAAEGATVFAWRDRDAVALEAMYAFAFDAMIEHRLSSQFADRLWCFLDEFRQLAPLECVPNVARRGRKSAVCLVASLHEVTGLYDRYGKDRAEELLGLFDHKVFLKIGSPITSRWASEYLGVVESLEDIPPHPDDPQGAGFKRAVRERPNVTWDELRRVPEPDPVKDVIRGYVDFPEFTAPFATPFMGDVTLPASFVPRPRKRRDPADERLPPFSVADAQRLSLPTKEFLECTK